MPRSLLLRLADRTYRSAWWRFVANWRPMAAWTLIVWALLSLLLIPLSSALLGAAVFRGDRVVVANIEILAWLLQPAGILYLLTAGGLAITGAVVRYAGLFRIITDDLEGTEVSVRQTLLEILPDLPALFKICVLTVIGAGVLLIPLAAGLGMVYLAFLGAHDINYYLALQPPEWTQALIAGGFVGVLWFAGALYIILHTVPTLPAYLDGHRPVTRALRESWRRTRGSVVRVLWLFILVVAAWLLIRLLAQAGFFFIAERGILWLEAATASATPVILATGAYATLSFLVDAVVSFVGFSFAATVLTKFYHEDTDLHSRAPAVPAGWLQLPGRVVASVRRRVRPAGAVAFALLLMLASGGVSLVVLQQVTQTPEVIITAHRAGALLAPENTLAALERSIEAGADFAEIDVQRTRDGVVVVVHDADLMRVAGDPRRIADVDFSDIAHLVQGHAPNIPPEERLIATLEDFLERSRGRIGVNIELKYYGFDPALADSVVNAVRRWEMEDAVVLMSLDLAAVRQIRQLAPDLPVGYVAALAAGDPARLAVDFLAVPLPLVTSGLIRSANRRGLEVHVWTLNTAEPMMSAIERGAHGIITDEPFLARRVVDQMVALTTVERLLLRLRREVFDRHVAADEHADACDLQPLRLLVAEDRRDMSL